MVDASGKPKRCVSMPPRIGPTTSPEYHAGHSEPPLSHTH